MAKPMIQGQKPPLPGIKEGEYEYFNPIKLAQAKKDLAEVCAGGDPENPEHILIAYLRLAGKVFDKDGKKIPWDNWKEGAEDQGLTFRKRPKFKEEE